MNLKSKNCQSQNNSSGDPNSNEDRINIITHADLEQDDDELMSTEMINKTYNSQRDGLRHGECSQQHEIHWNLGPKSLDTHHRYHDHQGNSTTDIQ